MTENLIQAAGDGVRLQDEYDKIVSQLPTRSPIFLPTDKVSLADKVKGVRCVKEVYDDRLDRLYRLRLRSLRDRFKAHQRCFIIGNGPSLNRTDLAMLKDEVTFAVNGFFLKAGELDWLPTFYVVEDHLVAEDRQRWINSFKGPTKLFPAYLAYCLDEADDTIFFNHRPRKSYPHGFDFSLEADKITYAGCTVTFTCMQLAAYLGFQEIYLIGVDADYDIPKDVDRGKDYGVGILDMKSDDPNHFHPDYFGKGFRWHDPQVNKMVEAYGEARRVLEKTDQRIYNATVGGKLEVFERRAFGQVLPGARSPDEMEQLNTKLAKARQQASMNTFEEAALPSNTQSGMACNPNDHVPPKPMTRAPRLLLIDITPIGDGTATGEAKKNLFERWPVNQLMQLSSAGSERIGRSTPGSGVVPLLAPDVARVVSEFAPEVVLYRPVPDNGSLHKAAMKIIRNTDLPLVTWIMDDWPNRLIEEDALKSAEMISNLEELLQRSCLRLSIGDAMSKAFEKRYGVRFTAFANGVDPNQWSEKSGRCQSGPIRVRYPGSLADNMTLASVLRVAKAIEEIAKDHDVVLEIKTRDLWKQRAGNHFSGLKHTRFMTEFLTPKAYREWVKGADIALIAYNFDEKSQNYVRYSIANKMPECLASGAAVFAHGPKGLATIDYLAEHGCAQIVDEADDERVVSTLRGLVLNRGERERIAEAARIVAFEKHNLNRLQQELPLAIAEAARSQFLHRRFSRGKKAHLDETKLVNQLTRDRKAPLMIDVGAHYGGSAKGFAEGGWRVFCFEPDTKNRKHLEDVLGDRANVHIDPRAVGEEVKTQQQFFSSKESTGISSMLPFTDGHEATDTVNVTTVGEIIREHGISRVDFLKIDVEGLDLPVLKGVPWDEIHPDVIECEFGTASKEHSGYVWKAIPDFLTKKGYTVFVSEWHPQIRFGIRHDWFGMKRYPCELNDPDGWGNVLAFKNDPGDEAMSSAISEELNLTSRRGKSATESGHPPKGTESGHSRRRKRGRMNAALRSRYGAFAGSVLHKSPLMFRLGQAIKRRLKELWKLRVVLALTAIAVASLLLVPFLPSLETLTTLF